jgi:hypothetical protein
LLGPKTDWQLFIVVVAILVAASFFPSCFVIVLLNSKMGMAKVMKV